MDRKATDDHFPPPAPKRHKPNPPPSSADPTHPLPSRPSYSTALPPARDKTEFPVTSLDDFYKHCPTYRLPSELGAFSLDKEGRVQLDRSQLHYYVLPAHPTRPNFDLNIGFAQFCPKKENVPANKLDPILRWISCHGDSFRPRAQPLSPDGISGPKGQSSTGNGILGKSGEEVKTPTSPKDR